MARGFVSFRESYARYSPVVREMLASVGPDRRRLFWIFPLVGLTSVLSAFSPYLAKLEIDQLAARKTELFGFIASSPYALFLWILAAVFAFGLFEKILQVAETQWKDFAFQKVESRFYFSQIERLANLEAGKLQNERVRKIVMEGVGSGYRSNLRTIFESTVLKVFDNGVLVIATAAVFALVDLRVTAILFIAAVLGYLLDRVENYAKGMLDVKEKFSEASDRAESMMRAMGHELPKMLSNHALSFAFATMERKEALTVDIAREKARNEMVMRPLRYVLSESSSFFVKAFVAYAIFYADASIGTMTMTVAMTGRIQHVLDTLLDLPQDLYKVRDQLETLRIFQSFTRRDPARNAALPDIRSIAVSDLSFRYPPLPDVVLEYLDLQEADLRRNMLRVRHAFSDYERYWKERYEAEFHELARIRAEASAEYPSVLRGVDLRVERGETVAIVGANGAGKTTLVSLLMGAFDSYGGTIRYDGIDAKSAVRGDLADHFSVIDQEPFLLYGFTVRDNLSLGVGREVSDDELWSVLSEFGLEKSVRDMYRGLDTEMGRQANLSGGQRQLLVLARVFLQDRPVAIFDEGTNQLDAENEARVMRLLLGRRRDRINVFITHRISTVRSVKRIYCLEWGRISAVGTSDELLAQGDNAYARFVRINESTEEDAPKDL